MSDEKKALTHPPKRGDTHRIDTDAVRVVRSKLTADWVERSMEDRDYGIDMMLEVFDGDKPTGILVLLQIKGHEAGFGPEIVMPVPVKTLLYARMFQAPFFLLNVSVKDNAVYFVWLQKYINTRLASENNEWDRQGHVNVYFPKDNLLDEKGLRKIRKLVKYSAHQDAGFTFMANLMWLRRNVGDFHNGGGRESLEQALVHLLEIDKLDHFLDKYDDVVGVLELDGLRKIFSKAKAYGQYDYGDEDVVNEGMDKLQQIENLFLSRDEMDAFIAENSDEHLPY